MHLPNRRRFLADVGRGMLVATCGSSLAFDLRLAHAADADGAERLTFGTREGLVDLLQSSSPDRMLQHVVKELRNGLTLKEVIAAAALANARAFAGEDYVGFHTLMALRPALTMAEEQRGPAAVLPVLKVLYRNSSRIGEAGATTTDALRPVPGSASDAGGAQAIRDAVHQRNNAAAERAFAASALATPEAAFNDLLPTVEEGPEVHRVVLAARAWDMVSLVGEENAATMLRQSLRYCLKNEERGAVHFANVRAMLPRVMDQFRLESTAWGTKSVDDAWVQGMVKTLWTSSPEQAAEAVAAAIVEGICPPRIFEALSLATTELVLRDGGRKKEWAQAGKPEGSVHGDSIGVHASDAAHAWRTIALASNARQRNAAIVLSAWHAAQDRMQRKDEFDAWEARPLAAHLERVTATDQASLLTALDDAIRANDQDLACAVTGRYGQRGFDEKPLMAKLRDYATSQDGALHAEKYYLTTCSNFRATSPAARWKHLVALSRVTASEYGKPAAGMEQARELVGLEA